jgi:hypothetical protein
VEVSRRSSFCYKCEITCLPVNSASGPPARPGHGCRSAGFARGAASFAAGAVSTARATGCTGTLVVRADSAFYSAAFTGTVRRAGAFFSVTVRIDPKVRAAIAAIGETSWTLVRYPRAIWDDQLSCWASDAEVAEVPYTAFASRKGRPSPPG